MIGGADENETEAQPSTRTATPPSPPSPPIEPPSSPLQGPGLGKRLLGSIRALALPASPPAAAASKVGLGLLLHLRPDHPATPSDSPSPSASDDPLEEDAVAARPHDAAGPPSPLNRYRIADAAATSAPISTMFRQWAAKRAPNLLQHFRLAADTADDQESGRVDGQEAGGFRAGDESRPNHVASPSEDESIATDVSSASEEDDPLEDAAERPHAADAEPLYPLNRYRLSDPAAKRAPANTMFRQWVSKPAADTAVEEDREDESDESRATHFSSASEEEDGDRLDATEGLHAAHGDDGADLALDDCDDAVGGDQEEKVLQHCTGDQLRAARDDQEVVQQGAIHPRDETTCDTAAEGQEKVGSAENVDVGEGQELVAQDAIERKGEGTNGTTAEDQNKAMEQCDTYGLGTTENGDAKDDLVEQCVIDKESAAMDDNAVKDHKVVGPTVVDGMCATIDDISAEDQEKKVEQCKTYGLGTTTNGDAEDNREAVDAVKDHEVVGPTVMDGMHATIDDISDQDKDKAVEQCNTYGLGTTENGGTTANGDAEDNGEVVEQCTIDKEHAAMDDNAVKDHEVVGPNVVDRMCATIDDISDEDQYKAVEQCNSNGLGTTENGDAKDDQEAVEQCVIDKERAALDDNAVKNHEVVGPTVVDGKCATIDDISAKDQEKKVEQCATYDSETIGNDDAVEHQEVVEQGVGYREGLTIDHDDSIEDHEVVEQSIIEGMPASTDDIAVEDQMKVVEQCAVHEPGATKNEYTVKEKEKVVDQGIVYGEGLTIDHDDSVKDDKFIEGMPASTDDIVVEDQMKVVEQCEVEEPGATNDEYTVEEKEKVVEQGVIDKQGATNINVPVKDQDKLMKQQIIDNQGTVSMDDIAVKDRDMAAAQYASDAIITYGDDDPVEEHNKVGNQGFIDENGRTKDDIDVEEHDYRKEQVIIDNWGTSSDATALEDNKKLCNSDEQIADKDRYVLPMKRSMLGQRTGSKQGATKSYFTVEKHKDVVERVFHEWGAPDDDLAMDTAASQSIREVSSSEVVSATANGSDRGIGKKEKVQLPIRYPQRPGKLNCPFYMSQGSCSYGFSCQFHHPPLKANTDGSWCPSEQGNHGVAEILELNRIGLPIREGARNCTYYMRNGACRYGKHCHFNHPEHVIDAQFYAPTGWEDNVLQVEKSSDHTTLDGTSYLKKSSDDATLDDTSYSKKSSDHATLDDTSYSKKSSGHATLDDTSSSSEVLPPNILRMLLPPQKVLPSTERKVMKVKKDSNWSSTSDDSDGCCSADSSDGPLCKQEHVDSSDGPLCKQEHVDYPERPSRPECPFYMRFGDCKFASACKYHHSKDKYPTRYHPEVPPLRGEQTEYPERPGEPECPFYMKKQFCKFGAQCRFNHPKDSNFAVQGPTNAEKYVATNEHQSTRITLEDHMPQQQQYPERPGQPDCRYYLQFGECKFLSACIFHHPRDGLPVGSNPSGPAHSDQIRPGTHDMPECPFYMKTGKCKFGLACEFRHPKDICSTTKGAFGHRTDLAYDNFTRAENAVQKQEQTMYPERPGEPQCFNYMRHGSCRFQMNCKYHHPADRLSRKQYDSTYH